MRVRVHVVVPSLDVSEQVVLPVCVTPVARTAAQVHAHNEVLHPAIHSRGGEHGEVTEIMHEPRDLKAQNGKKGKESAGERRDESPQKTRKL